MNIVICKSRYNDINNYYSGIAEALSFSGYNVFIWDKNVKPAFDVFDENTPDILILDIDDYDDAIQKCVDYYPTAKIAVRSLSNIDKRYDFLFSELDNLPKAANVLRYIKPRKNKMFECDFLYIGADNPILDNLCQSKYSFKLFGTKTRGPLSLGFIRPELIGDAFFSAKNVIHIYEDYTSQQIYEILFCRGKCLSNYPQTDIDANTFLENPGIRFFDKEIPLKEQDFYQDTEILEENRNWIYRYHTYFDRAEFLLDSLNIESNDVFRAKLNYEMEYL